MADEAPGLLLRDLGAARGRRTVLHGITAHLPRARVTAVVGANGAGKSTLLDVIAGVLAPAAGSVHWSGSRRAAYVVQRSAAPDTLPITVRATVEMGRWSHRGPWRPLTRHDRAVVEDCMARLDIGQLADRQLGALSGGQRGRALVAQGLAQESDLLLLDEPAAGLDLAARRRIDETLERATADGVTIVRVTHDLDTAQRADHVLLLHDGHPVAEGPPADVLTPDALHRISGIGSAPGLAGRL